MYDHYKIEYSLSDDNRKKLINDLEEECLNALTPIFEKYKEEGMPSHIIKHYMGQAVKRILG